jgi:hypothetical protein
MDNELSLQQQIQGLMKATSDKLELKTEEQLKSIVLEVETINQRLSLIVNKKDFEVVGQMRKDLDEINEVVKKNQELFDNIAAQESKRRVEKKSFGDTFNQEMAIFAEKNKAEIKNFQHDRKAKLVMELKVGDMLINDVTGSTANAYNPQGGILPNQAINFRDLIPTTVSPTGAYVTYREGVSTGSISAQTEGATKTQIDYAFTEVRAVSKYISGWAKFSKQLMYALPFLQNTLPRMLLRDFFKKENDYFYTTVAVAATGISTSSKTVDVEEMIEMIANQRKSNFEASFALVDWAQWARFLLTKPQDYSVPGGVTISPAGIVQMAGTPIIGASWAQTDHVLVVDKGYLERIETESLRVEFSYEDDKNFEFNLVTARVECFEEINMLRPDAFIYRDFGNS